MATMLEVRRWAESIGLPVQARGNLPRAVLERYNREHPSDTIIIKPNWHAKFSDPDAMSIAGTRAARVRWGQKVD